MRVRLKVLILLLFVSLSLYANPFSSEISLVIIDAGHGGKDPGAISNGVNEKDIVLSISKYLDEELKERGFNTLLTRTGDSFLELQERSDIANSASFDISGYPIFISIHANSASSSDASGFEVFIRSSEKKGAFISKATSDKLLLKYSSYTNSQLNRYVNIVNSRLSNTVVESVRNNFPSLKIRGVKEGDLWVLNATWMPAILIEVGFITNERERSNLTSEDYQRRMAAAIASAIEEV